MLTEDWSNALASVNLYDKDGNLVAHLNGLTDVCIGHTLTDEESRVIDYFNSIPCQSFSMSFKVPLWNRIKWKLYLLWLRIIGKCKVYRSSAK